VLGEMKKTQLKKFVLFCLILNLSLLLFPNKVKGDTWGVSVGTSWTLRLVTDTSSADMCFRVTYLDSTYVKGDNWQVSSASIAKFENYTFNPKHMSSREEITNNIAPISTLKTKTYGGREISCYETTTYSTYDLFIVDNATGIVVELTETSPSSSQYKLTSWTFYEEPTPISAYDILILSLITLFSIAGIIIYLRKKSRKLFDL
jgi:hypothetical protein